jgi:hypothetical protein
MANGSMPPAFVSQRVPTADIHAVGRLIDAL